MFLAAIMQRCDSGKVYQEVNDFSNTEWAFADVQRFNVTVEDTLNPHLLLVNVRNTSAYRYSNLWLFVTRIAPGGLAHTDTIECPLASADGRWLGTVSGDLIDNLILFNKDFRFKDPGTYTFKIQHGMRSDTLTDIAGIGLRVQKGYQ
jgi:gliding motility-associated lipoprotein GldH